MSIARLLFLAKYRVPHACFALQFDRYLEGIDYTIVATPMTRDELEPVWEKYAIDSSRFQYVSDSDIYRIYPQVNNWVFEGDYRGWWLRQQAIKLAYLDMIDESVMLMHDPDTFMIEPYQCWKNGRPNLMTLLDTTQGSYHGMFENITGRAKKTNHCFVTEFMPVQKRDFDALVELLQYRFPEKHWLDAIIDAVPGMPTVPPWGDGNLIKWFSEYELLGNWAVHRSEVDFFAQRRFEYNSLDRMSLLDPTQFNAVCDAVPDLSLSMQIDWNTLEIANFDRWLEQIKSKLHG